MSSLDSLRTLKTLEIDDKTYHYFSLPEAAKSLGDLDKLHNRQGGGLRIRRLKANVDRFIVISREIERELEDEGIPRHRCRYLPNGVDVGLYAPVNEMQKTRLRGELKLPDAVSISA